MSISSDEINYLIYRYLQENGYIHSAFAFSYESLVARSSVSQADVAPGALIALLQKGLEYVAIEEHMNEDGSIREFDNNFSLLSPYICESIATKEEKKLKKINNTSEISNSVDETSNDNNNDSNSNTIVTIQPSTINLKQETENRWLQLTGHQGEVYMCVWNPVQRQLASGSADGMCRLWGLYEMNDEKWNSKDGEISLRTAIMPHSSYPGERFKDVTSVTWSPDGQFLATGCYDGMARIWDNTGNLKVQLKEHSGPVFSLKWNSQGNYILSGSYDRRAIIWNATTGTVVKSFLLHSAPVLDVDWKDGDTFATCSSDMSIFVCKVSSKDSTAYRSFTGHKDEVNAVCWSPGGNYLASCSDDSTAKIWSIDKDLIHDLKGHSKEIYTVRWTPTGPGSNNPNKPLLLCTASFDGTVKVWNAITGSLEQNLFKQSQPVYSIAPSPNGEYLATGSLGGHVSVWSLTNGGLIREIHGTGDTFDVSWSHDGAMLCSCFSSGSLYVLDVSNQSNQNNIKSDVTIQLSTNHNSELLNSNLDNSKESIDISADVHANNNNSDVLDLPPPLPVT
eukprot:gene20756-26912_t